MRSALYVPANSPSKILNSGIYGADGIIFDVEDSVLPHQKDEARYLLLEMLRLDEYKDTRLIIRINDIQSSYWKDDLRTLGPLFKDGILKVLRIPKVESADQIHIIEEELKNIEIRYGLNLGTLSIECIIESPNGVEHAFEIASSSHRIQAMVFGAEDYCNSTGVDRYGPLFALDYPRSRIVSAAASQGKAAYDTVWGAFTDIQGLIKDAEHSRALGFVGKSVIHPDQIEVVNSIFSVSEKEIAWAQAILNHSLLEKNQTGAYSVNGVMVDQPVIERAKRILTRRDVEGKKYE